MARSIQQWIFRWPDALIPRLESGPTSLRDYFHFPFPWPRGKKWGVLEVKGHPPKMPHYPNTPPVLYLSPEPLYRISLARRSHWTFLVKSHKGAVEFQEK